MHYSDYFLTKTAINYKMVIKDGPLRIITAFTLTMIISACRAEPDQNTNTKTRDKQWKPACSPI